MKAIHRLAAAWLFALTAACGVAAPARDVEVNASGISVPFFDPAGHLTHRLTARQGAKAGERQNLRDVELLYFSPTQPNLIIQKVIAAEATWDAEREVLAGAGPVVVATQENRITGDGFDFTLASSLLHIQRDFKMDNAELVITSDRATVDLVVERAGDEMKVRDVKRCEAIGHLEIVVQPTAKRQYQFFRAYSETAIYDGATSVITLPQAVRYVRKDGSPAHSNSLTITLPRKEPGKSAAARAPH